jgi:hypothetical protein
VSLTSCYRYVLELPLDTLNALLRGALAESDSADVGVTGTWEDVPVGDKTATVSVRPDDLDTNPPSLVLTAVDLGLVLHLRMRVEVDVNEVPELDLIVYAIEFDLPGAFVKTADTPPELVMRFPGVTEPALGLVVSGGQIPLSPELIEPRIHALYDATPALQHDVQNNVPWPPGPDATVQVTTDIYDDEPGTPGFRGAISVAVADATHIVITMPGHFKVQGIAQTYVNTDMTIEVKVEVETDTTAGEVRAKLAAVQSSDVTVTFATASAYDFVARPMLAAAIAARIRGLAVDPIEIPTAAEVQATIAGRIVELASTLEVPVFTPDAPAAGELDLTTFVPTTLAQQVLALQLEPLGDATPCDAPDVFATNTGFSLAVAAVEVNPKLESITSANNGLHEDAGGSGYDVTVSNLAGVLSDPGEHGQADGHVWITGDAEVHVDCWADPDIEFWGPVFLSPHEDIDEQLFFTADVGNFGADDPCCADVDPGQIAALVQGQESERIPMPKDFSGVGELDLTFTEADIFAAGIVVHGGLTVVTAHALHASSLRRALAFWIGEQAGGG